MIRVIPEPGMRVRDPQTGAVIPDEGADVAPSTYWTRQELRGGVRIVSADPAPPKKATKVAKVAAKAAKE